VGGSRYGAAREPDGNRVDVNLTIDPNKVKADVEAVKDKAEELTGTAPKTSTPANSTGVNTSGDRSYRSLKNREGSNVTQRILGSPTNCGDLWERGARAHGLFTWWMPCVDRPGFHRRDTRNMVVPPDGCPGDFRGSDWRPIVPDCLVYHWSRTFVGVLNFLSPRSRTYY